jgi:hypothetical protein
MFGSSKSKDDTRKAPVRLNAQSGHKRRKRTVKRR